MDEGIGWRRIHSVAEIFLAYFEWLGNSKAKKSDEATFTGQGIDNLNKGGEEVTVRAKTGASQEVSLDSL